VEKIVPIHNNQNLHIKIISDSDPWLFGFPNPDLSIFFMDLDTTVQKKLGKKLAISFDKIAKLPLSRKIKHKIEFYLYQYSVTSEIL
jgi:hypothetical protein